MIYSPEKYRIKDQRMKPFIDPDEIWEILEKIKPTRERVREVIRSALDKKRL